MTLSPFNAAITDTIVFLVAPPPDIANLAHTTSTCPQIRFNQLEGISDGATSLILFVLSIDDADRVRSMNNGKGN